MNSFMNVVIRYLIVYTNLYYFIRVNEMVKAIIGLAAISK